MEEKELVKRRKVYGWRVCTLCGDSGSQPEPWHIIRNGGEILCDKCFKKEEATRCSGD